MHQTQPINDERNNELMNAISQNDSRKVTTLLEQGVDPNCELQCKVNGLTKKITISPLHLVSSIGNTEIALQLLDNGANVNAMDKYGTTPLFWAATSDSNAQSMCELLIQNNADINIRDKGGLTALHSASHRGKTSVLKLLIKLGADQTIRSHSGETSLDLAKSKNNKHCVRALQKITIDTSCLSPSTVSASCMNKNNKKWDKYTRNTTKPIGEITNLKPKSSLKRHNTHTCVVPLKTDRNEGRNETDNGITHVSALTLFNLKTHSMLLEMSLTHNDDCEDLVERQEAVKVENDTLRLQVEDLQKQRQELMLQQTMKHGNTHRLQAKQVQQQINKKDLLFHKLEKQKRKQKSILNEKKQEIEANEMNLHELRDNNGNDTMDKDAFRMGIRNGLKLLKIMDKKHELLKTQKEEIERFLVIEKEKNCEFDKWLRYEVKLPQYRRRFAKHDYDRLDVIKHLDKQELNRIGIRIKRHVKCIRYHIRLLNQKLETLNECE